MKWMLDTAKYKYTLQCLAEPLILQHPHSLKEREFMYEE